MIHLFDILFPPRVDERALRDVSIDQFLAHTSPSLVCVTRPETVVLLPFSEPLVRAAIHEAKYHRSERAFCYLGTALAEYLRDSDNVGHRASYTIAPVPLGKARRKERGCNQVEEVARVALTVLKKEMQVTLDTSILERTRETVSQVALPREKREQNMRGAFTAQRPLDPHLTYLVIDDVLTTGATLQAAIDALRAAGAEQIVPLALAH